MKNLRSWPLVVVVKPWLLITIITSAAKTCRVTCVQFIVSMSHRFFAGPHSWAIWRSIDNMCVVTSMSSCIITVTVPRVQMFMVHQLDHTERKECGSSDPIMDLLVQECISGSKYGFADPNMNLLIQISIVHLILFLLQGLQILPTPQKKSPEIYAFLLIWGVWEKGDEACTLNWDLEFLYLPKGL